MSRVSFVDLRRRFRSLRPEVLRVAVVTLSCMALSVLMRLLIDQLAPGAMPFGVVFFVSVLATLLGGWRPGLLTLVGTGVLSWWAVLPPRFSFAISAPEGGVILAMFFAMASLLVLIAHQLVAEQDQAVAERDLLLDEINHRVKNNFQTVVSLLEMQARRAPDPAVRAAIEAAAARVMGLARSHRHLRGRGGATEFVDMSAYLTELCDSLIEGPGAGLMIRIETDFAPVSLPGERAAAVGVILNELLTNAFKHAWPDQSPGVVRVAFTPCAEGLRLSVADDGVGLPKSSRAAAAGGEGGGEGGGGGGGGLGRGLIAGFARQAGGSIAVENGPGGGVIATLTMKT